MSQGWIKLYRQIQDCFLWADKPFDKARAWIDLLLLANHEDKRIMFNGRPLDITRGQYLTSIRKLSERWGWSYDKTSRFLTVLSDDDMVRKDCDNNRTLLTIVKYEVYQSNQSLTSELTEHSQVNAPNTHKGTDRTLISDKQECKNDKNEKKKSSAFVPPSLEDVKAYCQERNNRVDPQAFIDFYSSKGWFVGKNKMKDWKAAIRTWESRDKGSKTMGKQNFDTLSDLYAN